MSEHQFISKTEEDKKTTSESVLKEKTTSFENNSNEFSYDVMTLKSHQAAADHSPRSKSLNYLQARQTTIPIII